MDVPALVWWLTVVGIVALLLFDFLFHVRKAHNSMTGGRGRYLASGGPCSGPVHDRQLPARMGLTGRAGRIGQ